MEKSRSALKNISRCTCSKRDLEEIVFVDGKTILLWCLKKLVSVCDVRLIRLKTRITEKPFSMRQRTPGVINCEVSETSDLNNLI